MRTNGPLLIVAVSCQAYKDRADAVRATWGQDAEAIAYAVGRPGQPSELVGDTLYLDCADTYAELPRKTLALARYINEHLNFDYVFKCDDDTFVNVAALQALPKTHDLVSYIHSYQEPRQWVCNGHNFDGPWRGPLVSGGHGYLLSRRALRLVAECKDSELTDKEVFEDKMVADILRAAGISPVSLPGPPGPASLRHVLLGEAITAHPVYPNDMRTAHASLLKRPRSTWTHGSLYEYRWARLSRIRLVRKLRLLNYLPRTKPMLTFRRLGKRGRLGKQLWQIASTLGLAGRTGADICFNPDWHSRDVFRVPDEFFGNRRGIDAPRLLTHLPESDRVYMQDYLAWWPIADQVRRCFQPQPAFLDQLRRRHAWFFEVEPAQRLSVHVRRGDYVGNNAYAQLSVGYYKNAIAHFSDLTPIFFSDDPEWCARHFPQAIVAAPAHRPEEHLILMSLCRQHIIANSSFSYWGAVLAGNEAPIYPTPWYGPMLARLRVEWMVPPTWTPLSATGGARKAAKQSLLHHGPGKTAGSGGPVP